MVSVSRIDQWIKNAREFTTPTAAEALQESEDSANAVSSQLSSHLSVRQLKAKQALAQLKLYQLKKKAGIIASGRRNETTVRDCRCAV